MLINQPGQHPPRGVTLLAGRIQVLAHGQLGDLGWFLDALGFTTLNRTALNNNVGGASR